MLEILILIALSKNIAAKARAKGRSAPLFVVLLVGLWVCGEVGGIIAGAVLSFILGEDEANMLLVLGGGLLGIITGVVIAFSIVSLVSPVRNYDGDYGDYDDEDDRDDRRDRDRKRDRDRDYDRDRD